MMPNPTVAARSPIRSFGPEADRRRIVHLALMIEPNGERVRRWYCQDAIAEFDERTAEELCACGKGTLVVNYLEQILRGKRG